MSHALVSKAECLMTSKSVKKALTKVSITLDYPCYLYTYNYTYIICIVDGP